MGKITRLSNIEFLRLLLMFMILNLHSFRQELTGNISLMNWMDCIRESASVPSVTTFVLISGFFSIRWSFKKFFNFLYQVFFFIVVVHLLLVLIWGPVETNLGGGNFSNNTCWKGLLVCGCLFCPYAVRSNAKRFYR